MIEMGVVVGLGLLVTLVKMTWKWRMAMLSNPLLVDMMIFIGLLLIHWGTFSGVMADTIAGLLTSVGTSLAKKAFGYIEGHHYHPGYIRLEV